MMGMNKEDDILVSCAADPAVLSVHLRNLRKTRKSSRFIGFGILALCMAGKFMGAADLEVPFALGLMVLFFGMESADACIKHLLLIQHQQEVKQGDT